MVRGRAKAANTSPDGIKERKKKIKLPAMPLSTTSLLKIHKKQVAGAHEIRKALCCNLQEIIFAYKVELALYFNSRASCFTSYFLICAIAQP